MRLVRPVAVQAAATPPPSSTPTYVQSAYADSGASAVASQQVALAAPATAGNLIVGAGVSDATLTPSGISSMAAAASVVVINGVYIWYKIAAGGEQTLTLTPSVSDTVCACVAEYSGIAASSPLDVTVTGNGTGGSVGPISPGTTGATAQASELVVALAGLCNFLAANGPNTPVWTDGFTGRRAGATTYATNAQNQALFFADKTVSTVGPQTTTVSWTESSNAWAAILVTFKGA